MITQKTRRLITKYLNKQATLLERNELNLWLEDLNNFQSFKDYVKIDYLVMLNMDLFDSVDSKNQLLELIGREKKVVKLKKYTQLMKYAAVFILFLGLGYLYQTGCFSKPQELIPSESVTIKLENGNIEILKEDGALQLRDAKGNIIGKQKGDQLVYDKDVNTKALVYNTLTVPFGKQFRLRLSDGTKAYLNAGTSLRYPVKFIEGNQRQVFLTGEAFFDVASDKKHPFIVNTEDLNVKVLGTHFNVSAYPEDTFTDVVLVEGSVGLYTDEKTLTKSVIIQPGTMGRLNKKFKDITTEKVDTSIYTFWMKGRLVFRKMPFQNIVKRLERHYNMKISISNDKLSGEIFSANFKNDLSIEKVLSSFEKSYGIQYTIENNAIFIN